MAARTNQPVGSKAGFRKPAKNDHGGVLTVMLKQARKSGHLNLSGRGLSEVPSSVWHINLDVPEESKTVSLDNTEDRWWDQVDLTRLILASNILSSLSEDIILLPALVVLDVHDNHLKSLPESLGQLTCLQKLNISHNLLTSIPMCLERLSNLQFLHADYNRITEVGDHIGNLYYLEQLNLSHNQIAYLPKTIGYLSRLFCFNISNNQVKELPSEVGSMNSLRSMDCTHNQLGSVPEEIGQLTHLEQLYLRHNQITELPLLPDCHLKELQVGNNAIKEVSADHLATLEKVTFLDLRDNKISVLPDEITRLQNLERLDLTNNDLSSLPYVLGTLPNLKSIVLDGNPMKGIRRDIIMRGTNELKKYLRSRIDEPSSQLQPIVAVKSSQGTSGIIGASDGLDPFTVQTTKTLQYCEKKKSEIPEEVWLVAGNAEVSAVNFSKNLLSQWPLKLSLFSETMKELNLGFNRLVTVPPEISCLKKLVFLDLRNNQLSDLPPEVICLAGLREIILSFNRFCELPKVLYEFSRLEIILASDNQIATIDAEGLHRLSALGTLDLQNNNILQVPPHLGNCTQLRSLLLNGNPFKLPRLAILSKGLVNLNTPRYDIIPLSFFLLSVRVGGQITEHAVFNAYTGESQCYDVTRDSL